MTAENTLFKDHLNAELVAHYASKIKAVYPQFDADGFMETVLPGLESRELKARAAWIAENLRAFLPEDYPQATEILLQILDWSPEENAQFNRMALMPVTAFIEAYGMDHYDASMRLNYAVTQRFTAEFSIRPFIEDYPDRALPQLQAWTQDPSEHVRRLVSEGTRPRLPWASQLKGFIADPAPILPLLEALKDDPSEYVRRSVANNFNDIAKDHPHIVIDTLREWAKDASADRQWLIKHALRTLIKQGDPAALEILGFGPPQIEFSDLDITPAEIHMDEAFEFTFTLRSTADHAQKLVIDYIVHFVKANGKTKPKVFKLTTRDLPARETLTISRSHTIKPITTRKYYSGTHTLQIQVNGVSFGRANFDLVV